jgi:hypothetical protein
MSLTVANAVGFAMIFAAAAAGAKPADPAPGRAAVMQALSDCRKITEDAARLACYDKAAGALDQAETKGQVVVIDEAQVKAVRRQAFGFSLPTLNLFTRSAPKVGEGVDHVTLALSGARKDATGKWVFISQDGAVWRQTDDFEFADDPHKGSVLVVNNGLLGSFFCKIDREPQVRCVRVS